LGILNRGRGIVPSRESLNELRRQSMRVEMARRALVQRDAVLFDMVRRAVENRDDQRATMYANELSRVRHIKKMLGESQLAIDCIMIRIENFIDLCSVVEEMKPISEVIRDVSSEVQEVVPQFASVLGQLNEVAGEALIETNIDVCDQVLEDVLGARSEGGVKILGEASEVVEGSLRDAFPEPPMLTSMPEAEAVEYGGGGAEAWVDITDEVDEVEVARARRRAEEALT